MKIGIGSSEDGKHLKEEIKEYLSAKGYEITDYTDEKNDIFDTLILDCSELHSIPTKPNLFS